MTLEKQSYPLELPPDCPLNGATDCANTVFLLCESIDDRDDGFLTAKERGAYVNAKGTAACRRFGLSVFLSAKDCERVANSFPKFGRRVAQGYLTLNDGVILETPSKHPNHHTWWPYENISRSKPFSFWKQ